MSMPPDVISLLLQATGLANFPSKQSSEGMIDYGASLQPVDPALDALINAPLNPVLSPDLGGVPVSVEPNKQKASTTPQPLGANINGGADRVNANTANSGIRAVTDADGNVTLTNLVSAPSDVNKYMPDGKKIVKGGTSYDENGNAKDSAGNVMMPSTTEQKGMATNVQGLINQLRSTTDPDAARGISSQLTEAIAATQAQMYQKATIFASNKLQIPTLEAQLQASTEQDALRAVNGIITDSPATLQLRKTLDVSRNDIDREAKRFLAGNVGYNSLLAASKNAEAETVRITKLADRQDMLTASKELQSNARIQAKQDALDLEAQGLTTEQKNRIRVLDPSLAEAPDSQLVQVLKKRQVKNDGYGQALEAPDSDLPKMAAQGNSYANAILTAKEQAAGVMPEVTAARMKAFKSYSSDPKALAQGIALIAGTNDKKAVDAQVASLRALELPGASKESKAQAQDIRLQASRALLEQNVSRQFVGDVQQWAVPDAEIQTAIESAKNTVGKSDMSSVLTEYLGSTIGPERRARLDKFTAYATSAAGKTAKSQLGAVDPNRIKLMIQGTETRTLIDRIKDMGINALNPSNSALGVMFAPNAPNDYMNRK